VSEYLVRAHDHLFPTTAKRVIRNPMQPVANGGFRRPSVPPRTIGYIGNLSREKGVDVLLEAAPALTELGLELRIAGSGRLDEAVAAASRRLRHVSFDGVVTAESKHRFLESCDIGVIPSVWQEPGGPTHTIIEWLTAGRPTLVSPRGGLGEVIADCPGAIAVEPTVEDLVSAVKQLLEPEAWSRAVDRVRPVTADGQVERWV